MKKIIKLLIQIIIPYIIPHQLFKFGHRVRILIYTSYVSNGFCHFGKNSQILPSFRELRGEQFISIGDFCQIRDNVKLTAWSNYRGQSFDPQIIIGDGCSIGADSHITAINKIIIGKNVRMGDKILITDNAHGASDKSLLDMSPNLRPLYSKGSVIIEDNVWIGEKASILPNVHIGQGCIIAANAVVTKNVPAFCVVAGNPAKVIKQC